MGTPTALSRFLPKDYDPSRRIGLIAGRGRYPMLMAEAISSLKIPFYLIALEGDADPQWVELLASQGISAQWLNIGKLGRLLKILKEEDCRYSAMVGQVSPGKLFRGLHPDFKALQLLLSLKRKNADTIFGAIAAEMEKQKTQLLDARAFLDNHLATEGEMTGKRHSISEETKSWAGDLARQMAALDVGQSVVVSKGTIIAVEAFEGTDKMIERAGEIAAPGMVLVKAAKPHKDMRFDVPVFGERTLRKMKAANIRAALLETDRTMMLNKPALLQQARDWKMRIAGF